MKKRLFFVLILFFICVSLPSIILAQIVLPNPLTADSFTALIAGITTYIAGLIAGVSALMFSWAGILFLTSAGDQAKITQARKVVWYAIIGTAIALAAAGIVELLKTIIGVAP